MIYLLLGLFLLWVVLGVVLKTKSPLKTIYRKFRPLQYNQENTQYQRFDLEE